MNRCAGKFAGSSPRANRNCSCASFCRSWIKLKQRRAVRSRSRRARGIGDWLPLSLSIRLPGMDTFLE